MDSSETLDQSWCGDHPTPTPQESAVEIRPMLAHEGPKMPLSDVTSGVDVCVGVTMTVDN